MRLTRKSYLKTINERKVIASIVWAFRRFTERAMDKKVKA